MSGSNDHIGSNARRYGKVTIADAAQRLLEGGLVAVPTETVYGLAADSTNAAAVSEIYRTKGRPDFNPLIVHVPNLEAGERLGQFDALARKLAQEYWPGPLTLVLQKTDNCPVALAVTAGLETIAIRCPAHYVMQELLDASGLFLAAPSANKSGGISPTRAEHVAESLRNFTPIILDGGACENGVESTIVAIRAEGYEILRHGPVTAEQLLTSAGMAAIDPQTGDIEAPGQLASHYAPSKLLRLDAATAADWEFHIGFGEISGDHNLSVTGDLAEAASNLFSLLHKADASGRKSIAVAPVPVGEIGAAINDRLRRAAHRS